MHDSLSFAVPPRLSTHYPLRPARCYAARWVLSRSCLAGLRLSCDYLATISLSTAACHASRVLLTSCRACFTPESLVTGQEYPCQPSAGSPTPTSATERASPCFSLALPPLRPTCRCHASLWISNVGCIRHFEPLHNIPATGRCRNAAHTSRSANPRGAQATLASTPRPVISFLSCRLYSLCAIQAAYIPCNRCRLHRTRCVRHCYAQSLLPV